MHSTTDVGPYAMFGKRTSRTPQAKFRGEAATLSLTGIRPRDHSLVSRGHKPLS